MDLFNQSLSKENNLSKKFEEIHDYIYANDGLSPQQTLEEFVKILFVKIYDEIEKINQFTISKDEWANSKKGEFVPSFIYRISKLFDKTKESYIDIFDTDDRIKVSAIALGFTVNKLQSISLLNSSQDAKGLAFQKFLTHHEKDGRGQFFTPEPVIDFCVEMMQPKSNEIILDPACGSGTFLMSTLKFLKQKNRNTGKLISNNIFGIDINKSIARITKMKLLLEANVETNITCTNSLGDIDEIKLNIPLLKEGADLILTNPPFGAKSTNVSLFNKFDLGHKWTNVGGVYQKSSKIHLNQNLEILFIERCLQLLKNGGRMGIVLPNGNFENPSLEYLREYIKRNANILAVINLPTETFIPFGTGVKTSLLFIQKGGKTTNSIFFGRVTKLGYQGNKNGTPIYKKDDYGNTLSDENDEPVLDEDFSLIIKQYNDFKKGSLNETSNSFSLDYAQLNGRFDFDFYSPENRKMFKQLEGLKTVRLGDICEIIKTKSKKLKNSKLSVEYVELSDVNTHSYEIINSTTYLVHELPSRATFELNDGDIITAIAGNSVGTRKHATALVNEDFQGSICTNGFRVLRNFKIDIHYLLFFLKSEYFLKQMFMYRTGAAIPNVSDIDLANMLITIPDKKIIKSISSKMKRAFDLRIESRKEIDSINLNQPGLKIFSNHDIP